MALSAVAAAQDKPPAKEIVPLKIQVVISRYQGEKRVSSMPYMLSVNANEVRATNLRMGAQVPVMMGQPPAVDGKPGVQAFNYKDVGTNIDCSATTHDDGRFRLQITIEDTSVIADAADATVMKGTPSFRSFRSSEYLLIKDGQSIQFTTATDKVTGDVVKIDLTLTVIK
jgi:hypothetical protein